LKDPFPAVAAAGREPPLPGRQAVRVRSWQPPLYGGNYRRKDKKDGSRGTDYKSPVKRIYVKGKTVKRNGKPERHGIIDVDKKRRRYPVNAGKKIIRFPDLVDKTKKQKIRNYPDHVCHGFFYTHDNITGNDGVDTVAEKSVVQQRGFNHPVIEKPMPKRTRRRRIVKPRTDGKINDPGDYSKTDDVVVKYPAFEKIPGKNKKHQNIADIEGKPRFEGNVVKTQKFPHRKKKQKRRMGKDYGFLLPFRSEKTRKYKTAEDRRN
jgi:hypothetical protein